MGVRYRWEGQRNPGEKGWQEWFPGKRGLPPRDLSDADVAGFSDEQRALLESPAGRRLYQLVIDPVDLEGKDDPATSVVRQPKKAKQGVATQGDSATTGGLPLPGGPEDLSDGNE